MLAIFCFSYYSSFYLLFENNVAWKLVHLQHQLIQFKTTIHLSVVVFMMSKRWEVYLRFPSEWCILPHLFSMNSSTTNWEFSLCKMLCQAQEWMFLGILLQRVHNLVGKMDMCVTILHIILRPHQPACGFVPWIPPLGVSVLCLYSGQPLQPLQLLGLLEHSCSSGQEYKWRPTYHTYTYLKVMDQANKLLHEMYSAFLPWQMYLHNDLKARLKFRIFRSLGFPCWTLVV